ncbi:RcgA family putative transporter [Primorskyibacter sp. 2E233]|uniref:RcgA family putative transporter n=1 Tax=Primorskyibacter sp. 2E233 TaxID=3413431 RepID=UPI003BF31572
MILNGKKYLPPPDLDLGLKELFRQAVSFGTGRPVDKDGLPDGPWTPQLLAEEISMLDANCSGVDLRTVQLWFQDNVKGISASNIRWLARIFGCGDPDATSRWQVALGAAQNRLVVERRKRRHKPDDTVSTGCNEVLPSDGHVAAPEQVRRSGIVHLSESMFLGGNPLCAIVVLWACQALLIFASYIVGSHIVTYSPVDGASKQVGLLWSPNWLLDRLLWLPIMILLASDLIQRWRDEWRPALAVQQEQLDSNTDWARKLEAYGTAFWAILIASVGIVFLVQWYGAYLRPLLRNDVGDRVVDWLLVATVRPEAVEISEAIVVSGFANLVSGGAYWLLFTGLLMIFILVSDFAAICRVQDRPHNNDVIRHATKVGARIARRVFCYSVMAILIATQIKLVALYLMTDTSHIVSWLVGDASAFFGFRTFEWNWLDKAPSASITSFFVLFVPCFVYAICAIRIRGTLGMLATQESLEEANIPWWEFNAIIVLLVINFWSLGQFDGFSVLLCFSVAFALFSLIRRGVFINNRATMLGTQK